MANINTNANASTGVSENANLTSPTLASAPTGRPKDPVERAAWYARMRERMGKSRFEVAKIPAGYTPYWARKDDNEEMSRLDVLGFKVVRDDPKNPRYKANGLKEDGTYVMGDVILMEISTDEYDFYKEVNTQKAENLVSGVPAAFIAEAARNAVPAFAVDENHRKVK
jgi:hypothetical protein